MWHNNVLWYVSKYTFTYVYLCQNMPGDGTKYGKPLQMYIMTIYLGNRGQFTKFGYEKCYPGILESIVGGGEN